MIALLLCTRIGQGPKVTRTLNPRWGWRRNVTAYRASSVRSSDEAGTHLPAPYRTAIVGAGIIVESMAIRDGTLSECEREVCLRFTLAGRPVYQGWWWSVGSAGGVE